MKFYEIFLIFSIISAVLGHLVPQGECFIPSAIQDSWFSLENGIPTSTVFNATSMSTRGNCITVKKNNDDDYSFIFKEQNCYYCIQIFIRSRNILEKYEGSCKTLPSDVDPTFDNVCGGLKDEQQLVTLFKETYAPSDCHISLENVQHFTYEIPFRFTGVCNNPDNHILATEKKLIITYKKCEDIDGTFYGIVHYNCMGDWFVGEKHFFAVANPRESRKGEKYRCFLKNRDDDLNFGLSITAECNTLEMVEKSPERLNFTPVKA